MRMRVIPLALAILLAAVGVSVGQESADLDFVRGLRARQYPDLALEYLLKLRQSGAFDKEPTFLLELARTRLELAAAENETGRRLSIFTQAREELDAFLTKYPEHPQSAEAELDIARLAALQGKAQLSKALRVDPDSGQADALLARQLMEDAATKLGAVQKKINERLAKLGNPADLPKDKQAELKSLEHARVQVEMDLGLNMYDQALTYLDTGTTEALEKRAEIVKKSIALFKTAANRDAKDPLTWQAKAWAGRCQLEMGDPSQARKALTTVVEARGREAELGQRLARYFLLLAEPQANANVNEARDAVIKAGIRWLADYPAAHNSPEGFGVRFELARARVQKALALDPKKSAQARTEEFGRARVLCKDLEQIDNDFIDKARQLQYEVIKAEGGFTKDIKNLKGFEDCYIRARYEASVWAKAKNEEKDAKKWEETRVKQYKAIITALERGLDLDKNSSRAKAAPRELQEAQSMLAAYYLFNGDLDAAIRIGEPLARAKPPTSQASAIADYVLGAYAEKLVKHLKANDPAEEWAKEREQFWQLAQYMEQSWPREDTGNRARYQMGQQLVYEKKYPEAVEILARIPPTFPNLLRAKFLLADAALRSEAEMAPFTGPDKRPWIARAQEALESIPELPTGADPGTTFYYLQAKYKLALIFANGKKFDQVEPLADKVLQQLPMLKLENEERAKDLHGKFTLLKLFAVGARAGTEYSAGHYSKVREILDPVVDQVKDGKLPDLNQNPQLRRSLLNMDLSANIQDGQLPRAQEVLKVLQANLPDDEKEEGSTVILKQVSMLIQDQVRGLRGKTKGADEFEKVSAPFVEFLDKLKDQNEKASPEVLRVLAMGYASLDKHKKAIDLLKQIPEPKGDAKLEANYHGARILYSRELRLDKKLDEADKVLKEIQDAPWGKKNLEVKKESIHMLAAREKYPTAIRQWYDLLTLQLLPKINQDPQMKAQYFECSYYLCDARYQAGVKAKDEAAKTKWLTSAAKQIVQLEIAWPDMGGEASKSRFQQLLDGDEKLQRIFEEEKAKKSKDVKKN